MKPSLFSTEMVRAILDGRKTQTRRVIKPQPDGVTVDGIAYRHKSIELCRDGNLITVTHDEGMPIAERINPRYQPGDIIWVRETWAKVSDWVCVDPAVGLPDGYIYKADWMDGAEAPKWRPSIHMPRAAARLFLLVKAVRIERLQEITEEDARAEGFSPDTPFKNMGYQWSARENFAEYWDTLNTRRGYPWDSNPWVEVITFERTEEPS